MTEPTDFVAGWNDWHESRVRATTSPLGLASLVATHWLTPEPVEYEGLPGTWRATETGIEGRTPELTGNTILQDGRPYDTVEGATVTLTSGQDIEWGDKRLRFFERDGAFALRLFDPDAASRASITGIDAFAPDPAWVLDGSFRPAETGAVLSVESIDGHRSEDEVAGVVEVELPGGERAELTVTGDPRGLSAVFSDGTSGGETYRFRFLTIPAADENGAVTVDFNRAYLPPCAFADFYVCPLPAASNRLSTPIRAGEKQVVRA